MSGEILGERGIAEAVQDNYWPKGWYRFPLLPVVKIRQPDMWNTWFFNFHWLAFRLWTMDSPDIGVEINLDDQTLQIRGRIPFVIFGLFIPLFPQSWAHKLWRKSRQYRERFND